MTAETAERAEAREWARRYICQFCGARAKVGYKKVSVTHSRNCPNRRRKR